MPAGEWEGPEPAGDSAPVFTPRDIDPAAEAVRTLPRAPGLLERVAVRFLRRQAARRPAPVGPIADPVHILTRTERMELRRIVEASILRAFFAGVASAVVVASVTIYVRLHGLEPWLAYVGAAGLVMAVAEMVFVHRTHLLSMLALMRATGAQLVEESPDPAETTVHAMARAALELPDPVRIVEGIDPWRETSVARLYLLVALYRLKRGLSKFAAEFLVKQAAPNTLMRVFAPATALPVTALWNAFVSWKILREARIRVLGPSASEEVFSRILADTTRLSEAGRMCLYRAVGMGIVLKRSVHPNLLALLEGLVRRLGPVPPAHLDDRGRFLEVIAMLSREEQVRALQVLSVAAVVDGRLVGRERVMIRQARRACGLSESLTAVDRLLSRFSRGDPIDGDLLDDLAR